MSERDPARRLSRSALLKVGSSVMIKSSQGCWVNNVLVVDANVLKAM